MPYIKTEARALAQYAPKNAGELNYQITRAVDQYLSDHGVNYTNINAAVGALECAKIELYRRIAVEYEDKKLAENGDVYRCV